MNKLIALLFVFILWAQKGISQFSFGPEFGQYFHNYQGTSTFDTIRVDMEGADRGEMFGGVFIEQQYGKNFSIISKLLLRPIYISYSVYNFSEKCLFCPVEKGGLISVTNLSIELMPQVKIPVLQKGHVNLYGGLNLGFNFSNDNEDVSFNGRHSGVALVINSMDHVVNPVTVSFVYGFSFEYWRIIVWAKYQHRSRFSNNVIINEQEYPFNNTWEFLSFSVGYKFFGFKRKKK